MKKIRHIRQFLQKRKSRLIDIVLGLLLGVCLSYLATVGLNLISSLPNGSKDILLLLSIIVLMFLIAWLILLYEKYDQCKRYLSEHCPGVDLDSEDEFSDAFSEATKKD